MFETLWVTFIKVMDYYSFQLMLYVFFCCKIEFLCNHKCVLAYIGVRGQILCFDHDETLDTTILHLHDLFMAKIESIVVVVTWFHGVVVFIFENESMCVYEFITWCEVVSLDLLNDCDDWNICDWFIKAWPYSFQLMLHKLFYQTFVIWF